MTFFFFLFFLLKNFMGRSVARHMVSSTVNK
jgi:hypothetical protein